MKKNFRYISYVLFSILIPGIISIFKDSIKSWFGNEILGFFAFVGVCLVVALIIEVLYRLFHLSKKETTADTIVKINNIGDKYRIPVDGEVSNDKHQAFFTIPSEEEELAGALDKGKKYRQIIYYSLSAKDYLNWIDYTYFSYLKEIRKRLKCQIIIALHYNDKLRATKLTKPSDLDSYHHICEWYSKAVKSIIGEDTIIMYEDQFYRKNPKDYAVNFHNIYVNKLLEYSEMLSNKKKSGEKIDFESFKRKLSYVESAFPIKEIARKYKKTKRLYVLDRITSQEIWKDETLSIIKKDNKFVFITASTLSYPDGKFINVHKKENVPNFTDSQAVLREKVMNLDTHTKKLMYSLLSTNIDNTQEIFLFPSDDLLGEMLINKFAEINREYHFDENPYQRG